MSPTEIFQRPFVAPRWRMWMVFAALTLGLLTMAFKAARLQLVLGDDLRTLAEKQYIRKLRLDAPRGTIFDRDRRPLAVTVSSPSIYASPKEIEDVEAAVAALKDLVPISEDTLRSRLSPGKVFVWLARKVSPESAEQIRALSIRGIGIQSEPRRYYPNRSLAGQLLGRVSLDGEGQYGVERLFDEHLRGRTTVVKGLRDNHGRRVLLADGLDVDLLAGDDITLTLDAELQYLAEELLQEALQRYNAKSAFAVLLDAKTGAVRVVANAPTFNPNAKSNVSGSRRNRAIGDAFEPGSTFKIVTFGAALDAGVVSPDENIFCENGKFKLGKHTIHDSHKSGWLTASEVFTHSSNIGTLKIAQRVGEERFREKVHAFGFGKPPGLGLVGESKGRLPKRWGEVRLATVSFGHGLLVTPMQLATMVMAVANDGVYRAPHLYEKVESAGGRVVDRPEFDEGRRVLKSTTAETLVEIMKGVTQPGGSGRQAHIEGISVAGKTGTAEKVDPVTGRYSRELHTSSFVGFAPADDPSIVAVVVVDEPKGNVFGGSTAGPVWRELVRAALIDEGTLNAELVVEEPVNVEVVSAPENQKVPSIESLGEPSERSRGERHAPDFSGLSLRDALRVADSAEVDLKVSGSGFVVDQTPAAGTRFDALTSVSITLEAR